MFKRAKCVFYVTSHRVAYWFGDLGRKIYQLVSSSQSVTLEKQWRAPLLPSIGNVNETLKHIERMDEEFYIDAVCGVKICIELRYQAITSIRSFYVVIRECSLN